MNNKKFFFRIIFPLIGFLLINTSFSQQMPGSIMIVGGGTESSGGWSDTPYGWVVEQAENKRVAIIAHSENPGSWMPDYFEELGAEQADNFSVMTNQQADQQSLYDDLKTYDAVFFKGGDQSNYYLYYKDTKLTQAVKEIFEAGGVISGTSAGLAVLSDVIFTAENGTVYSYEALRDPNNQYMTLADDFLNLFPGYIFDSHFVERSRFGRLIGFMGHWKLNQGEEMVGVGVDDKTALCIDREKIARVYGTGAVRFYQPGENNNFRLSDGKLLADNLQASQLLHNDAVQLNEFNVAGLGNEITPEKNHEDYPGTLFLSAIDGIDDNTLTLTKLKEEPSGNDSILIVTGNSTAEAEKYRNTLSQWNFDKTEILNATIPNGEDEQWIAKAERIRKFLFVDNDESQLKEFTSTTPAGQKMLESMRDGVAAFVGDDSRLPGQIYCANYRQVYASYDGLLEFEEGLGLLNTTTLMPNTFTSSDYWENTMAAVPYAMNLDSLKYGLWLSEEMVLKYFEEEGNTYMTAFGDFPAMFIENNGTMGDFSDQSAVSSGEPRDVAGFKEMKMRLIDNTVAVKVGSLNASNPLTYQQKLNVYPNPAGDWLFIKNAPKGTLTVFSAKGERMLQTGISRKIDISGLKPGVYFIRVAGSDSDKVYTQKILIK
ncbi:MAG: Type 1 glutamine amidotransferase-like domain-containing protein [Bacteroidales bacterium]|nr:Type 1 glutamine amidotransferase-like domain-containing protein [Bacteroidales bacterium]MCF8336866.1 Type 1 glutamine amidotransferase-like domain-containing protein [Bacteroidales bacterium]